VRSLGCECQRRLLTPTTPSFFPFAPHPGHNPEAQEFFQCALSLLTVIGLGVLLIALLVHRSATEVSKKFAARTGLFAHDFAEDQQS
jgi:hypothetical protein